MNKVIASPLFPSSSRAGGRRAFLASTLALAAGGAVAAAPSGLPDHGAAPEFRGITQWLNSQPLTLAELRGKVVLVDFWTYACINCLRTLPHINRWADSYSAQGLVVVGVHTPEFPFERVTANVLTAMRRFGVKHAVAQDNSYATWKAWDNKYWPATCLVDAQGRVRYRHVGEGQYAQTEAAIRSLLAAAGGRA